MQTTIINNSRCHHPWPRFLTYYPTNILGVLFSFFCQWTNIRCKLNAYNLFLFFHKNFLGKFCLIQVLCAHLRLFCQNKCKRFLLPGNAQNIEMFSPWILNPRTVRKPLLSPYVTPHEFHILRITCKNVVLGWKVCILQAQFFFWM